MSHSFFIQFSTERYSGCRQEVLGFKSAAELGQQKHCSNGKVIHFPFLKAAALIGTKNESWYSYPSVLVGRPLKNMK